MNARTIGFIAGAISAGLAAWWYSRQINLQSASSNRGTVIFDNTPTATPLSDRRTL